MTNPDTHVASGERTLTGSAAVALLLLTLAFGALSAALVLTKGALLDGLPYREPSRLVALTGSYLEKGQAQEWPIGYLDFLDWRKDNKVFEDLSVYTPDGLAFNLVAGGQAERLTGELVSAGYFHLLRVQPELGRTFTPEEDGTPFTHPVAVLGHDLWQRRFGGDPGVVGRTVELNGAAYRVIGVAPAGFRGVTDKADLWVPSAMAPGPDYVTLRRLRWLSGVGRLKPGVTLEQAQAEMDRLTAALQKQYPLTNQGMGARLRPLTDTWFGSLRTGLRNLALGTLVLLALTFAAAAPLLRTRKTAVVLSVGGAALGLALAAWAVPVLAAGSGLPLPSFLQLTPSLGLIAAVLALAVLGGFAAAAVTPGRRLLPALAIVQTALALVLLVGAGLLVRDYRRAVDRDLGFRSHEILTLRLDLRGPKYADDPPVINLVKEDIARVSRLPGVARVGVGGPSIPTDGWTGGYMTIEDHDSDAADGRYFVMLHVVSANYFGILGIPVLQGRGVSEADTHTFGAFVSRALADQQWPGQNPIGKRLKLGLRNDPERPWLTVLGVVADVQHEGLLAEKRPAPDIYVSAYQFQFRLPLTVNVLVEPKPGVAAASLAPAVERELRAAAPDVPPYDVATLAERLDRQTRRARFQIALAAFFAALATALAAVTLAAARRTRRPAEPRRSVVKIREIGERRIA